MFSFRHLSFLALPPPFSPFLHACAFTPCLLTSSPLIPDSFASSAICQVDVLSSPHPSNNRLIPGPFLLIGKLGFACSNGGGAAFGEVYGTFTNSDGNKTRATLLVYPLFGMATLPRWHLSPSLPYKLYVCIHTYICIQIQSVGVCICCCFVLRGIRCVGII